MYKLLIVDDETDILEYLYMLFTEWDAYELEVFKASSADKALELLNMIKMDIVLSDIKMPGMSGLQLLDEIKFNWPECKVIFLTGYKEFEYIYKATRYSDVEYLLKTSTDKEILLTVENAILDIEEKLKMESVSQRTAQQLEHALPLLKANFVSLLLNEAYNNLASIQMHLIDLCIPLKSASFVFMILGRFDQGSVNLPYSEKLDIMYRVKYLSERFIPEWMNSLHVVIDGSILIWLLQPIESESVSSIWFEKPNEINKTFQVMKGAFESIQDSCEKTLGTTISLAMQSKPIPFLELGQNFEQLRQLINSRIGAGTQMLLTEKNLPVSCIDFPTEKNDLLVRVSQKLRNPQPLSIFLELGQRSEYFQALDQFLGALQTTESMQSNVALEIYQTLSLRLLSFINQFDLSTKLAFKIGLYKLTHVSEHASWKDAAEYLHELSGAIFDIQMAAQIKRADDSIMMLKQYIRDNINKDLSLIRLADIVNLNPSYLSRLFKQETGENISSFINQVRMKKATELISNSKLKINEISVLLGFDTPTYFTRFFKKSMGFGPQEYRDMGEKVKKR